ncbi:MAG: tetratricopeptide repeat protein [Ignavibacteriales bacterium]
MSDDSVEITDIKGNVIGGFVSGSGHILGQNVIVIKELNVDMSSALEKIKVTRADAIPQLSNMEEAIIKKISDWIIGKEKETGVRVGEIRSDRVHLSRDELLVNEALNECTKYALRGNYDKAMESCNRALQLDPDNSDAWTLKGGILRLSEKYEEAIKCYDKAIEIKPDDAHTWGSKAGALTNLRKYEEAIKCYDKAIECYNRAINTNLDGGKTSSNKRYGVHAWTGKAEVLYNLKDYIGAIKCYNKALEIDPDDRYVDSKKFDIISEWNQKAAQLADQGKYLEAIKSYDKLLDVNPDHASTWLLKGYCLEQLGKYLEAVKSYDKSLEIDPDADYVWNAKGRVLKKLGKYDEAIKCFKKADEIKSKNYG